MLPFKPDFVKAIYTIIIYNKQLVGLFQKLLKEIIALISQYLILLKK